MNSNPTTPRPTGPPPPSGKDLEILSSWLSRFKLEEYARHFTQAGYDIPTISRMTPEDLIAIGVTDPTHRRTLKAEIGRLNVSDEIPDFKPDSLETWLRLLRLDQYLEMLWDQGYTTVDKVTELAWEDLEDIGICKLGHQKKMMLAIKRIEDINRRPARVAEVFPSLPRPTSLASCYLLHGQEVAISTGLPPPSPTTPELKTFQQLPAAQDCFSHLCNSHSLESLELEDSAFLQSWQSQEATEDPPPMLTHHGTASLHRPKTLMVKARPVAKIAAKSRPPPDDKLQTGYSSTTQAFATLRLKKTPPRPPRRTDSIRGLSSLVDDMPEEMAGFAACVKGLTSQFSHDLSSFSRNNDTFNPSSFEELSTTSANEEVCTSSSVLRRVRMNSLDSLMSAASADSSTSMGSSPGGRHSMEVVPPPHVVYPPTFSPRPYNPARTQKDGIEDIESMLIDLSHQLDAILKEEVSLP